VNFAEAVDALRAHEAPYPIWVRRRELGIGKPGVARFTTRHGYPMFEVEVDSRLPDPISIWVLIHEWAHCMTWDVEGPEHSDEWGVWFARLWRDIFPDEDHSL
jgi:hypothetical protein